MTQVTFAKQDEPFYRDPQYIKVRGDYPKGSDRVKLANQEDSLFHYKGDTREVTAGYELEDVVWLSKDKLTRNLVSQIILDNTVNTSIRMDQIPNWQQVRDNTFIINTHLEKNNAFFESLYNDHEHNTLFLHDDPEDVAEPTAGRHGVANSRGPFYDIYNLQVIMNNQQEIILEELNRHVEQMDAMRFLVDPLDKVYYDGLKSKFDDEADQEVPDECELDEDSIHCPNIRRHAYGHSNWFVKARYLSAALWECYPMNFRNIVIKGASKMIAQDKLKLTKLQQFLAACGRLDTRIILVD